MTTVRFKGTVVGNGAVVEGIQNPSSPTQISIQGNPTLNPDPGSTRAVYTNVSAAIAALAVNGAASIYVTTNSSDKTAIEGAVSVVAASNQD